MLAFLLVEDLDILIIEDYVISADADFVICGEMSCDKKPEGPFGDHLGYYSLKHDFPYLKIHKVYAKIIYLAFYSCRSTTTRRLSLEN